MLFLEDINGLVFDTLISESHQAGLSLTQYPVEFGTPITDHSFTPPKVLTLNVGQSAHVSLYRGGGSSPARLADFYGRLMDMREKAELFTIATPLYKYENMCVTGVSNVRAKGTETVINVTVTCTEVRIANLRSVDDFNAVYKEQLGVQRRASPKAELGPVNAAEVPPESAEAKNASTAALRGLRTFGVVE